MAKRAEDPAGGRIAQGLLRLQAVFDILFARLSDKWGLLSCAGGPSVKPLMSCGAASDQSERGSVVRQLVPDLGIVDRHHALLHELPGRLPAVGNDGVGV